MIRLLLLLLGTRAIRRYRFALIAFGALVFLTGVAIFIDALTKGFHFPIHQFGYLVLLDAAVMVLCAFNTRGTQRRLMYARSALLTVFSLLIINGRHTSVLLLAIALGLALLADSCLRIASALVLRFPFWKRYLGLGIAQLLFALFLLEPYPTHYAGTVHYCIGAWMVVSGLVVLQLGISIGRLSDSALLPALFSRGWLPFVDHAEPTSRKRAPEERLIVHVWTAYDTAQQPLNRPVLDRYIAAVDAKGVISTGHAALEVVPDVYVSHYPGVEIDRNPEQFAQLFRATAENDIAGRFLPSYERESAGWCESVWKITFDASYADIDRARRFWQEYRKDDTYNLTRRNCSSTVVQVLEVALEGSLLRRGYGMGSILRALFSPELWVAAQLRRRAETMAWTPGLALDYARALFGVLHPPPVAWWTLARRAVATRRKACNPPPLEPRSAFSSGSVRRVDRP
ncbi:MAG TPA: hypothetical protein VGC79_21200 [Polyangiaceae bacterium]